MVCVRSFVLVSGLFLAATVYADDVLQVPAAIQISSNVSEGSYAPEDIIRICRQKGMKAVIFTDRDFMRWEYGLWPLRAILKKTVTAPSVYTYGFSRYLDLANSLQAKNPDMVVIAGVESSPFYFWQGSVLNGTLTLRNWHQHVLTFGLAQARDYETLPVTANPHARQRYDQYHGDAGIKPYQYYFEYVASLHGLTFWAHPEVKNYSREGAIDVRTDDLSDYLLRTTGYTGFVFSNEGQNRIGSIGGIWDEVLAQYCRGQRQKPVWALSGLAFDTAGRLEDALDDRRTIVLVRSFDKRMILESLGQGRMYIVQGKGSGDFRLEHFTVSDPVSGSIAQMGQELAVRQAPRVRIAGNYLRGQAGAFTIKLIRNGKVIKRLEGQSEFDLTFEDQGLPANSKSFYRVQIEGPGLMVISNPVFVTRAY